MSDVLIACHSINMGYSRQVILPEVTLDIRQGDILGILGPNGAGKSTLLKTLLGIIPPLTGAISFPAGTERIRFGYVPQRQVVDETYPLTVEEIVMMGRYGRLRPGQRPGKDDREAVHCAIEEVGLDALKNRLYRELSGGQKQRILMARALASDPTILVLDEPTTDMDLASERSIIELISSFHTNYQLTILVVSHLLYIVLTLATMAAFVDRKVMLVPIEQARQAETLSAFYGVPVRTADLGGVHVAI